MSNYSTILHLVYYSYRCCYMSFPCMSKLPKTRFYHLLYFGGHSNSLSNGCISNCFSLLYSPIHHNILISARLQHKFIFLLPFYCTIGSSMQHCWSYSYVIYFILCKLEMYLLLHYHTRRIPPYPSYVDPMVDISLSLCMMVHGT